MRAKKNNVIILIITFFLLITLSPKVVFALAARIEEISWNYDFRSLHSCDTNRSTIDWKDGHILLKEQEDGKFTSSGECWTYDKGFHQNIYSLTLTGLYSELEETYVKVFVRFDDRKEIYPLEWGVTYNIEELYRKLRLKIFLSTDNPDISPTVDNFSLNIKLQDRSERGLERRDNTRVSELKRTKRNLDYYYNDFDRYPVVKTKTSDKEGQWGFLKAVLDSASVNSWNKNYNRSFINQQKGVDDDYKYGYLTGSSGFYYLLWTRLEDVNAKHFQDSWQGQILDVDCTPPTYCIYSRSDYVAEPLLQYFEENKKTSEIEGTEFIKTENSPQVWLKLNNHRFWLRTPDIFTQAGGDWDNISLASSLGDIPLLKFVKKQDEPEVYLVTASGLKRHMPNNQILHYYGQAEDIVIFEDTKIIDLLPENYLIRGKGQNKVYFLDQKIKRWVTSPEVLEKLGFDWLDVVVIDPQEVDYYAEGTPIF